MKSFCISLLGLGVVGTKLLEYIRNQSEGSGTGGMRISIGKVFVRDVTKKRGIDASGVTLTDDPSDALRDADIVIDCMGGSGADLTRELILTAARAGKAVIMSSKKCLAKYGREIESAVRAGGTSFHYDATVGGCIPISAVFAHTGKCETISSIFGICNATSNFILDEMARNYSYESALRKAQALGYAENDPAEDVDGLDALYKAVIIMGFGMGHWADCGSIKPVSISRITRQDHLDARRRGQVLKPVFSIDRLGEDVVCQIGPQPVSKASLLGSVRGNSNIIVVRSSESGERAFIGQGAGAKPTASAMFDDLIRTIGEMKAS